jgi:surface antigen
MFGHPIRRPLWKFGGMVLLLAGGLAAGVTVAAPRAQAVTHRRLAAPSTVASFSIVTQSVHRGGEALVAAHVSGTGHCSLLLSTGKGWAGPFSAKVRKPYIAWRWREAPGAGRSLGVRVRCRVARKTVHLGTRISLSGGRVDGGQIVSPNSMRIASSRRPPTGFITKRHQGVLGGKGGFDCSSPGIPSVLDKHGYCSGYCTAYVASRRPDLAYLGNATDWFGAARAKGIPVGSVPVVGAAAWWSGSDRYLDSGHLGHIAYVESVTATTVTVSEMNYYKWNVRDVRTISLSDPARPQGYIYGGPAGSGPPPTFDPGAYVGHIVKQNNGNVTAWLVVNDNGPHRNWIPDQATYNCLKSKGAPGPDLLSAAQLNQMPDENGVWAYCTSPPPPTTTTSPPPTTTTSPPPTTTTSPPPPVAAHGTVEGTGGIGLNERTGPGPSYAKVGNLPDGTVVNIVCQATGPSQTGPWGADALWDKLDNGTYVSDAWVYTGSNGRVAPAC